MAYIFAGTKCFNMDIPHTSGGRLRKDFLKGKMDPPLARVGISGSDNTICHGLGESPPTHPTSFISFHSIQKYSTSGHQWHWPVFVFSYLYLYSFPFFVSLQFNDRPLCVSSDRDKRRLPIAQENYTLSPFSCNNKYLYLYLHLHL